MIIHIMFDFIFFVGLIGSLTLVLGAAWPEPKTAKHPTQSIKNWLFVVGALLMLFYAVLGYRTGGTVFFVFLEIFILISNLLMMLDTDDRLDAIVMTLGGLVFVVWSLYLFDGYSTLLFILGLTIIGFGYAFTMNTLRRSLALTLGSIFIALFSYVEASWVFFWLNVFFALFSAYYLFPHIKGRKLGV